MQTLVRIYNRHRLLTWFQDIEFSIYGRLFQAGRNRWGTAGMGGNGQYNRLAALDDLADEEGPWRDRLTEDQDLGLRLIAAGWKGKQDLRATVDLEGLEAAAAVPPAHPLVAGQPAGDGPRFTDRQVQSPGAAPDRVDPLPADAVLSGHRRDLPRCRGRTRHRWDRGLFGKPVVARLHLHPRIRWHDARLRGGQAGGPRDAGRADQGAAHRRRFPPSTRGFCGRSCSARPFGSSPTGIPGPRPAARRSAPDRSTRTQPVGA